jgi:hypothetical protein
MRICTVAGILTLIAASLVSGEEATEKPLRGGATPEECFKKAYEARAAGDYAEALKYVTDATACFMVGQTAFEIEQMVILRWPKWKQAHDLLDQHGLGPYDITGEWQDLADLHRDPSLAFFRAGAWVEDQAAFLKAAGELLEASLTESVANADRDVADIKKSFDEKRAAAKDDGEKRRLDREQKAAIELRNEHAFEVRDKLSAIKDKQPPKVDFTNIKVKGAVASLEAAPDGKTAPLYFRRIEGRWFLAVLEKEPRVVRPEKKDRSLARIMSLGQPKFDGGNYEEPTGYKYEADDTGGRMRDSDLKLLLDLPSLTEVELIGAKHVTDQGLASLTKLPNLKTLKLQSVAFTATGLESLVDAKSLRTLQLINLDISDEAVTALRGKLTNCTIEETYGLEPIAWNGGFEKQRDRSRFAIFIAAEDSGKLTLGELKAKAADLNNLTRQWTPTDNPHLKPLARAVERLNVQVFSELPYDEGWWKKYPWFKRGDLPQYAIFAPNSDEPVVLKGAVSAQTLGAELAKAARQARRVEPTK